MELRISDQNAWSRVGTEDDRCNATRITLFVHRRCRDLDRVGCRRGDGLVDDGTAVFVGQPDGDRVRAPADAGRIQVEFLVFVLALILAAPAFAIGPAPPRAVVLAPAVVPAVRRHDDALIARIERVVKVGFIQRGGPAVDGQLYQGAFLDRFVVVLDPECELSFCIDDHVDSRVGDRVPLLAVVEPQLDLGAVFPDVGRPGQVAVGGLVVLISSKSSPLPFTTNQISPS